MTIELVTIGEITERAREVAQAAVAARRKEVERLNGPDAGRLPDNSLVPDDHYDDVITRFERFHDPMPAYAEAIVQHLEAAMGYDGLSAGEMAGVGNLHTQFGPEGSSWRGEAAEAFDRYYLEPFDQALVEQKGFLAELASCASTYDEVLKGRRKDCYDIGQQAVDALDSMMAEKVTALLSLKLSLLGAAIGIVAVPIAGGGSAALTMAIIGGAASSLNAVLSTVDGEGGATVDEFMQTLYTALDDVDRAGEDAAQQLADLMDMDLTVVTEAIEADGSGNRVPVLLPQEPDDDVPNFTDGDGGAIREDGDLTPPS